MKSVASVTGINGKVERGQQSGVKIVGGPLNHRTKSTLFVLWQPGIPKHKAMRIVTVKLWMCAIWGNENNGKGAFGSHATPEMLLNQ